MPWSVKKDARCPASKPFGVVGGSSGDRLAGCHATAEGARAQQSALYVHEAKGEAPPPVSYSIPPTRVW